jgi:hypothetical protein
MTLDEFKQRWPRIVVVCEEQYLLEALEFATVRGLLDQLAGQFDHLNRMFQPGSEARLYHDLAPHSFYWEVTRDSRVLMNGGLIYHPSGEQGETTFSVRFDRDEKWQLHA